MKITSITALLLCLFSQSTWGQAVYGVFSLPPATNLGEKQIGTVSPANGDISLLGTNTSVEDGRIDMTTGATALNVTDSKSYFIGEDNSDAPTLVDRIYTVDLLTGITDTSPILSAGYTTSTNFGIWFDDQADIIYGLFSVAGNAELASIDPITGAVTTVIADVTLGDGIDSFASGLMTGGIDNTNSNNAKRIFAFINDALFSMNPDTQESFFVDIQGGNFLSSKTFGLEWDNNNNALWILYNPDLGERRIAQVLSEDEFTEEAFVDIDFGLDGGANISTASGLSALDEDSGLFFFIGRPTVGPNANKWSLYTADVNAQSSSNVDIEDAAQVQTNGYAGIEVLPGPDMTFTKSDGDVTDKVPGDSITYTLSYSNDANAGATNGLTLTETVPAETTFDAVGSTAGWVCADVIAGSSCVFTPTDVPPGGSGSVDFAVTVDSIVSVALVSISNSATMSATNIVTDLVAADTTPITANPVLEVTKTDNDLLNAIPGDTIAYDIAVTNSGDRVASNMFLTETVPTNTFFVGGLAWTCLPNNMAGSTCTTTPLDLGAGSSNLTFDVQVIDSVPAGTTAISNTVTAAADNATSIMAADTTPITSAATLSVAKSDDDITLTPGSTVVYQIDYANTGNQDAEATTLTEVVLAETVFAASSSDGGWVCLPDITAGSSCSLDLGTLGGGNSGSVDFALTLNTPVPGIFSQLTNTVVMDASNASAVNAQDTTPIDASVDLRLVKTDGGVTAALSKVINYTLINFNEGDRDALSALITETVPDNTTFYPPSSTVGWNCVPDNTAGSSCTFDLGGLPGLSGKNTVFFAVKVDESLDSGVTELTNTATLSAFNSLDSDEDTELTPVDQIIPSVTLVDANPSITEIASCSQNDAEISEIVISFTDDNAGIIGVNDPANYALIDTGMDQDLQTLSCDNLMGDDVLVNIITFATGGTATNPNATLTLDEPLTAGQYVLLVCDDITDAAGNALDGDGDGFTGGNLNRQFRIEFDNLFDNAYLDDCADAAIELTPWMAINQVGDMVDVTTLSDADDSSLSGSVFTDSLVGMNAGIEQCVEFPELKSHAVSLAVLGSATQMGDLELQISCDFSDLAACGNVTDNHTETFTLPASVTPSWASYESIMLLPVNTLSANCSVEISSPTNSPFTNYLDALQVRDSELIFASGFEGD